MNEGEKLRSYGRKDGLSIKNVWAAGDSCKKISKYRIKQKSPNKAKFKI